MPDLNTGDLTLHYQVTGQGPALILIGGLGMPLQGWSMQARTLSKTFTVVRLDNRGCGRSTIPDDPYTVTDMAKDVLVLMDHLALDRAHVMGISMGGFIALELALLAPERIIALILAHTAPRIPPSARQRMRLWQTLMDEGASDQVMALEQLLWVFPEKAMEKESTANALLSTLIQGRQNQSPTGFSGQVLACDHFDVTEKLADIPAPALLISSVDDISIPLTYTRMLEALPGFQKTRVFDIGGHATHLIHADAFNRAVLQFLAPLS